jgi:hypothetical protein
MVESVVRDFLREEDRLKHGHSSEIDDSKKLPSGWWVIPAAFLGLCIWTYVIYSILQAFIN